MLCWAEGIETSSAVIPCGVSLACCNSRAVISRPRKPYVASNVEGSIEAPGCVRKASWIVTGPEIGFAGSGRITSMVGGVIRSSYRSSLGDTRSQAIADGAGSPSVVIPKPAISALRCIVSSKSALLLKLDHPASGAIRQLDQDDGAAG